MKRWMHAKAMVKLCGCTGLPQPSLFAFVINTFFHMGLLKFCQLYCCLPKKVLNNTYFFDSATFGEPTDLTFQHAQGEDSDDVNARETLDLLREMCESTEDDIRPETPRDFSNLVFMMKKMNSNGLKRVYNQAQPKNKLCRKNAERVRYRFFHSIVFKA